MLPKSLRNHPEPCRWVSDAEVHAILSEGAGAYVAALRTSLRAIADGRASVEMPSKQIFEDPGQTGDFRVMPCVVRSGDQCTKTVKVVGTNLVGQVVPDQVTVGKAFVLDPEENFVTHVVDACLLSSARTGAVAALGAKLIAPEAKSLAIVGCGRVAFYAAKYVALDLGLEAISLIDAQTHRAERLAEDLEREIGIPVSVGAGRSFDVVLLATTSAEPFFGTTDAGRMLTISVGADTTSQRELLDEWHAEREVLTDTLDSPQVGDLMAWHRQGLPLPRLATLVDATRQPLDRETRLFISTGSALYDNLSLRFLVDQLAAAETPSTSGVMLR